MMFYILVEELCEVGAANNGSMEMEWAQTIVRKIHSCIPLNCKNNKHCYHSQIDNAMCGEKITGKLLLYMIHLSLIITSGQQTQCYSQRASIELG